uniref:Adenosine deaminase domain-containing protein n=1 Tax=Arion vulgaris TaxID=1028688 RepID=A0A0B7AZ75_9EUPU
MSGRRNAKFDDILNEVKTAMEMNKKYPNMMMGYDLVGNEDFFNPLLFYLDALLYPSFQNPPYNLPYFLHVGETNWQNTATDNNMVEAILLNATRIGHGFALPKRPGLLELVKERNIAIEVNPLSNQMLRIVADLRNHPMASLMADDFPIVVSSDDIAVWEALPLSHDIYMAFMDMSGQDADLTFLKQLAINSIKYSTMNKTEMDTATKSWETKWNSFIQEIVQEQNIKNENKSSNDGDKLSAQICFLFLCTSIVYYVFL